MSITLVIRSSSPNHRIGDYDSQANNKYFKGISDVIQTVPIRSAEEIVAEFWTLWASVVPPRMPSSLIAQILTESPELPAEEDPSTFEFITPEE